MSRRVYPENAPTIFVHGGCDVNDAVNIELIRSRYRLDGPKYGYNKQSLDFNTEFRFHESPSIMSMYSTPSSIAYRVYDSLKTQYQYTHDQIVALEETLKYPVLEFYKRHAKENDILVIGFISELNLKIKQGSECFTVSPNFRSFQNPLDPLHWLYTDFICNTSLQSPFFEYRNLQQTKEHLKDFVREIYSIFKDRVIIVDTHMANVFYENNSLRPLNYTSNQFPFYSLSRFTNTPADSTSIRKWMTTFIRVFKHFYPCDISVVSINRDDCFMDPNHRFGPALTHLHPYSINKIGTELYNELEKINTRCKNTFSQQLII